MGRTIRLLSAVFAISAMAAACGDLGPTAPVNSSDVEVSNGFLGDGG